MSNQESGIVWVGLPELDNVPNVSHVPRNGSKITELAEFLFRSPMTVKPDDWLRKCQEIVVSIGIVSFSMFIRVFFFLAFFEILFTQSGQLWLFSPLRYLACNNNFELGNSPPQQPP